MRHRLIWLLLSGAVAFGALSSAEAQRVDFDLEVAKGDVPRHTSVLKFGENPDLLTASGFEVVWDAGGDYVPPTQARLHNVASTLAADAGTLVSSGTATGGSSTTLEDTGATFVSDGVVIGDLFMNDSCVEAATVTAVTETLLTFAGGLRSPDDGRVGSDNEVGDAYRVVTDASTGASVFWVQGLDASRLSQSEFVITNGVSNVATAKSYTRQFRARVFGSGTTGALGIITSTAQVDGTVSCQIVDGNNQTLMAVYTVPADKNGFIRKWWGSLSKKQSAVSSLRLRAGALDRIGYVLQARTVGTAGSSEFVYDHDVPLFVPGGVDIWIEADTDTNGAGVSGGFDIILVDA